ncbi:carboxymuconolactone decarboxylase family protein [Virgibacillus litoralis]|nr:carboxymuconolactone decarboxylase family protein [Virgibacillus litoralis]
MVKNKKNKTLTAEFSERIMLAVTEVNGCEVCSYAHTKIALEKGLSNKEIQMLLSGNVERVSPDEVVAIAFSQHYADTKGNPTRDSWNRLVDVYGTTKALEILTSIRTIMLGNVYGIPLGAFRSRLKGKLIKESNLLYEISMILSIFIFLPISFIHSLISSLLRTPVIQFKKA